MDLNSQIGYMLLNEEGAVLSSTGDLENDEKFANSIMGLLNLSSQSDLNDNLKAFKKISLTFEGHCYIICFSNRKIQIVKRKL